MNAPIPLTLSLGSASAGDSDPVETAEWRDAFSAMVHTHGPERARFILDELAQLARGERIGWQPDLVTPYVNTISVDRQPVFPGDLAMEERLASYMRWNALAMVVRANQAYGELATTALVARIDGREVRVAVEDVDIYGRLVGTVFVNDSNINLAMVEQGHAWWYEQYARDAVELELAEQQARAARRGLWASGTAVEPWEWRRR